MCAPVQVPQLARALHKDESRAFGMTDDTGVTWLELP
jgi:hypothetical protein